MRKPPSPVEPKGLLRVAVAAVLFVTSGLLGGAARAASEGGETLGFVVAAWGFEVPATRPRNCPHGMNVTEAERYGVDVAAWRADIQALGWEEANRKHFPPDACTDPTAQPDPGFYFLQGDVEVDGLDLDNTDSKLQDGGACPHDDFTAPDGRTGIDNQFWRLFGCTKGFRFGSIRHLDERNTFTTRMHPFGHQGPAILVEVSGVNDRKNDDDVQVRIFSSADRVTLDAKGDVVSDFSFGVHENTSYWGPPARGRIEDGILTTEPVDLRLRFEHQIVDGELVYRGARLRATLNEDGGLTGILGYYWDAENLFRIHNDHSIDGKHTGRLAAHARGYTCAGIYHALGRVADGHRDPESGKCTTVSAATHFHATPAFVIHEED